MTAGVAAVAAAGDLVAVSSLYESEPIGGPEQGHYLNAVAVVDTNREPREVLGLLLMAEKGRGRERRERWGARTLDLDVLVFGSVELAEDGLSIPHPRMVERRFVMEPLAEVWPGVSVGGRSTASIALELGDQDMTVFADGLWWGAIPARGRPA